MDSSLSAPAIQTQFNCQSFLNLNLHSNLHPSSSYSNNSNLINLSNDNQIHLNQATIQSNSLDHPSSNLAIINSMTFNQIKISNSEIKNTRNLAMGKLNDSFQRRLTNDNKIIPISSSPTRHSFIFAGGLINPKRNERKTLGLRAAVGSFKQRVSHLDPINSNPHIITSDSKFNQTNSQQSKLTPIDSSSNNPIQSKDLFTKPSHSEYLAARRTSIMSRINGHRRVLSDSHSTNLNQLTPSSPTIQSSLPTSTSLPSLDQIRSWAAQRRTGNDQSNSKSSKDSIIPSSLKEPLSSHPSSITKESKRSKSLQIYSHGRDPSIPQICLCLDSDDEEDESSQVQSPQITSTPIVTPPPQDGLAKALLSQSYHNYSKPSLENRAEQRRFLLQNLAQAHQRRTGRPAGSPIVVAPV